ncbi:MAG TPA: efflux RND transporter permease subunit, partial [Opitutaceae bacterium]
MSKFFINRPIVAIVIAIITVIIGAVALVSLPIAQFPKIVPPEARITSTYVGADAQTVEQAVATPIEQTMSGVDNLNYMTSINGSDGSLRLTTDFDIATDPNVDLILSQMRVTQAGPQLPADVTNFGVTVQKQLTAPLMLVALYSPTDTYDSTFLANYAYININDQLTRVPGIASATVFGAGQYAMRYWVKPDQLAKLNITVSEIIQAVQSQNTVNPAGTIGGEPAPKGQQFTYSVRAQGRLTTPEEFGAIVIRENPDGSAVRLRDVARVELGAQVYNVMGRMNGKASAIIAIYQLPGSNALDCANGVKKAMAHIKERFPEGLDYQVALDTTQSVSEGMREISQTLWQALLLVILVVFVFLQGWRPTLIPLLAVPVSLIGTFMLFPVFGFSVNTLSLFGLVLAIGLVVDDAIVVVEAVEHHIEEGLSPRDATLKAMEEVSGPVIAIAVILAAVFVPTAFIPGITGRLYQQFALTIAISVMISAFNALSLSPALCAMLLRPKGAAKGPLGSFYGWFNRVFGRVQDGYVNISRHLIQKSVLSFIALGLFAGAAYLLSRRIPTSFLPEEDQGYVYVGLQLPNASSLQRTSEVAAKVEEIMKNTPGVRTYTSVIGFSLLSTVYNTYSGFFFVNFKPWSERTHANDSYAAIKAHLNSELAKIPEGRAFAFSPPSIPGIGTAGGFTFVLEDRAGKDIAFLASNVNKFMAEASKRPEIAKGLSTTFLPAVPQVFVKVDRDKVLKQGVALADVYKTLQCYMGGIFVNYFNRFGRQWQVYV